eukprot:scaffold1171_cov177-Amphora_coffeaeformis.AAC.13
MDSEGVLGVGCPQLTWERLPDHVLIDSVMACAAYCRRPPMVWAHAWDDAMTAGANHERIFVCETKFVFAMTLACETKPVVTKPWDFLVIRSLSSKGGLSSNRCRHQLATRILSSKGLLSTRHASWYVGSVVSMVGRPRNGWRDERRVLLFRSFLFHHGFPNINATNATRKRRVRTLRKGTVQVGGCRCKRTGTAVALVRIGPLAVLDRRVVVRKMIDGRVEDYGIFKHLVD